MMKSRGVLVRVKNQVIWWICQHVNKNFANMHFFFTYKLNYFPKKDYLLPKIWRKNRKQRWSYLFFPLGEVKVKKKTAFLAGRIKKTIIIDKQLDGFLKEFGNRIIDNNNTSCKQIIEETISGGGDSKDFNTGRVKCCRYCNNVLHVRWLHTEYPHPPCAVWSLCW